MLGNQKQETAFYLVDNGSLRAESYLKLKEVAKKLSKNTQTLITPCSVLHSSKIPAEKLDGEKAELFIKLAQKNIEKGIKEHIVIPYFIGPSSAITDYLPKLFEKHITQKDPSQKLNIRPCLADKKEDQQLIAQALKNEIERQANGSLESGSRIALVDHGSPKIEVTQIRNQIAIILNELFGQNIYICACSMERREAAEYDFNEPLLENYLKTEKISEEKIYISLLFLGPGRHAGKEGDISKICERAKMQNESLSIEQCESIGGSPEVLSILETKVDELKYAPHL